MVVDPGRIPIVWGSATVWQLREDVGGSRVSCRAAVTKVEDPTDTRIPSWRVPSGRIPSWRIPSWRIHAVPLAALTGGDGDAVEMRDGVGGMNRGWGCD